MRFREHTGDLAESTATEFEFHTLAEFSRHIEGIWPLLVSSGSVVEAKPFRADDHRNGWKNVHIVIAVPGGILGFTDGPLPERGPGEW